MKLLFSVFALLSASLVSAQHAGHGYGNPYNLEAREPDPFDDVYTRAAMDFDDTIFDLE